MAAELVGGAFLSASLQVLFDRLASQELVDFVNGNRPFDRLLKDLKIKLLSANMVLNDAEEKQIRNPSVKKWLDELKDAIFEAEDLTAEIKFQALECKMGGGSFSRSGTSQVMKLIPSPFSGFDNGMKSKLVEILDRLDFILKQKDMIGLREGVDCRHSIVRLSATLARESGVYGEFCSRLDDSSPINLGRTRHLSYMKRSVNNAEKFKALFDAKYLRTFLPLGWKKESEQFPWNNGSGIKQLKGLKQLCGYLCISGLQNVLHVEDAIEANLKDKKFIKRLFLKWDSRNPTDDSQKERMILGGLQPHRSLKELVIISYGGTRFPDWVGDNLFSGITTVSLNNCKNCCLMPPLGQLPSLRKLHIRGFDGVVKVGAEFYSNGSVIKQPFRSLEVLRFGDMPQLKEWTFIEAEEGAPFPHLKELYLIDCPELVGSLPAYLRNLTTLYVTRCQQLMTSLQRDQHIDTAFPSLRSMEISDCPQLESFFEGGLQFPSNLNELSIINCKRLFADRFHWNLQRLASLTWLRIRSVYEDTLDSFPEEGVLPITLTSLSISNLPNLKALNSNGFKQLNSLKQLWISSCEQLQCLPKELPKSLSYLFISECPLLIQRCQRGRGQDWPNISHITRVRIDGEFI
ncbi:hypothetical protein TIFTF001_033217 [Ficus carica]|uniref:Rx N-terminal domain-containing protein n=1 Tax=Ficus carica TaxID=3494 RepID=A0AA88J7D4_FICCA|nr:hypothetical protein TIFTF001_033217 [Ficus carica]